MSEEKKKIDFDVQDGKLKFKIDPNADGEPLAEGEIVLSEALGEAFKKGEKIEGAKSVDLDFSLSKLVIKVDTDKDGEKLLEIKVDLSEALDEAFNNDESE